jgi:hypothetical protein
MPNIQLFANFMRIDHFEKKNRMYNIWVDVRLRRSLTIQKKWVAVQKKMVKKLFYVMIKRK